jgi:hypothetical protein
MTEAPIGRQKIQLKIRKILKEVETIHSLAHPLNSDDPESNLFNAKSLREDAVRMTVLQMSLAIESVLDGLFARVFIGHEPGEQEGRRRRIGKLAKELQELLEGGRFGFESKLKLARVLGLVTKSQHSRLDKLRALRNKCAHSWMLNVIRKRGRRSRPTKRVLEFNGRNLFDLRVLESFMQVYSGIYLRLFGKYLD